MPTSLRLVLAAVSALVHRQSLAEAEVLLCLLEKTPPAHRDASTTRTTTVPAMIPAWSWRFRLALEARRAICRSIFARASLRCRSLLEATGVLPLQHS